MPTYKFLERVKETSTSTGTGNIALAGAVTGFVRFNAAAAAGEWVPYEIHAVDGTGAPTGEWEVGYGKYSADTLTREEVVASSAVANAKVSFSAGTKQVSLTVPASLVRSMRRYIAGASLSLYVRMDGNDANSGLVDSAGGAFKTLERAVLEIDNWEFGPASSVIIYVGFGTFTTPPYANALCVAPRKAATLSVTIAGSGPSSTYINGFVDDGAGEWGNAMNIGGTPNVQWEINDLCLTTSPSAYAALTIGGMGSLVLLSNVRFSAGSNAVAAFGAGNVCTMGGVIFAGNLAGSGMVLSDGARGFMEGDITFNAAMSCSAPFLNLIGPHCYANVQDANFINKANLTGERYSSVMGSIIDSAGGGATFLPGTVAGTVASGGQYL